MRLLVLFLLPIVSQAVTTEWIDPHDMSSYSKKNLKRSSSAGELREECEKCNCDAEKTERDVSLVYLKRVINLLLKSANVDESNPGTYRIKLNSEMNKENYKYLVEFANSDSIDQAQLRKLDTVLYDVFSRKFMDDVLEQVISVKEMIYFHLVNINSLIILATSVFLYITYTLFKSNFSIKYVLGYFIVIIIIIDYAFRYSQLYEEAEEHNMNLKYSVKCDTSKMNWTEWLKFIMSKENCEKKVITPLEVALSQLKHLIIVPLTAVGTGMGKFGGELWNNLPFPWNVIIFPVMLLFCFVIFMIILMSMNQTPFKVNLMHLLHFETGKLHENKNKISGATLDKLLDAVNSRPRVEDVRRRSSPEKPPLKLKGKKKKSENNSPAKNEKAESKKDDEINVDNAKDEEAISSKS